VNAAVKMDMRTAMAVAETRGRKWLAPPTWASMNAAVTLLSSCERFLSYHHHLSFTLTSSLPVLQPAPNCDE
jgi:hypothetical protein